MIGPKLHVDSYIDQLFELSMHILVSGSGDRVHVQRAVQQV
jgi:hypothetical protein